MIRGKQTALRLAAGYLIGVGAVAPGLSGGAVAVVFGVYQRLVEAVAHLHRDFRKNMGYLLPLGLGGMLGVVSLGRVLTLCFALWPEPTQAVFLGLMAGTLPFVARSAARDGMRPWYVLLTAASFGGGLWLFLRAGEAAPSAELTFGQLLLCGGILGFGTVVPGVSSSFILLSLGCYEPVLRVIDGENWRGALPLLLGFGGSALLLLKLVEVLYCRWYGAMSFTVLGLVLSSMVPVCPPLRPDRGSALLLLTALCCAVLSYIAMRWMGAARPRAASPEPDRNHG